MQEDNPPKKFALIVVAVFGAVLAIFLLSYSIKNRQTAQIPQQQAVKDTATKETLNSLVVKDSDEDGIPDWEEPLWGTDPTKKDSDDNGIEDKVEIDAKKATLTENGAASSTEELNETQKFARDFLTVFMALKQSGNLSQDILDNFSTSLSEQALQDMAQVTLYAKSDLKITTDISTDSQFKYIDSIKKTAFSYKNQQIGSELEILNKIINLEDGADIKTLYSIGTAYEDFAKDALALTVPQNLAENHLIIINNALILGEAIKSTSEYVNNPLKSIMALVRYNASISEFNNAIEFINKTEENLLQ